MASAISIINSALIKIGCHDRISSLTEQNSRAQLGNERLPYLRQEVLEAMAPRFARTRVELAVSATEPDFDYDYQFPLPADCIRVLKTDLTTDWIREGSNLLTYEEECHIVYVYDVTDYGVWTPTACEALATRLAADLAIPIADSKTLQATMLKAYDIMLKNARFISSTQGTGDQLEAEDWINARY